MTDDAGPGARVELADVRYAAVQGGGAVPAVAGVTLSVAAGEAVGLLGPSGSGKSTLLRLVAGLEAPDSGRVEVGGVAVHALSGRAAARYRTTTVGFVLPRSPLLDDLSALDNVTVPTLPLRAGLDARMRGRDLLERVGLGEKAGVLAARLSDDEQRRVTLARALINRPRLLLADEPSGGLDSRAGQRVLDLLLDLRREHGATLLLCSHDSSVVARCGRLIRLRDGAVTADEPIRGPASRETYDRVTGPG